MKRNRTHKTTAMLLSMLLCLSMIFASGCGAKDAASSVAPATEQSVSESQAVENESSAVEADQEGEGVSFTDQMGREVTLEKKAEKIVALTASDVEIICALGGKDLLVGRGEYCDYPAQVMEIPSVESGAETNIEQIVSLSPDVVVMAAMAQTEDQIKQLENAGITVIETNAQKIEDVYETITMLGNVIGKETEAEALINSMKDTFEEVSENPVSGTVYFEVSPLQYGLWAAGKNTFMDEVASMMGLTNIFADVEGWAEVSEEQVIERDPDYIVTTSMYFGEGLTPVEEIESRSGWENVKAVKNQAILNLDDNSLTRPAPRLADGALALKEFVQKSTEE